MNKKGFSLLLIIVFTILFALPASAAQVDDEQLAALEISNLINNYRAENGMYQYVYNSTLAIVAQKHTEYQVSISESTHVGEGDSTSKDRVVASGYGGDNFVFADEMIYSGQYATPQKAFDWWKNSEIHNGIMLSDKYHEIGIGVRITEDRIYYTINVASIQGVTAPGVGSPPVEPVQDVPTPVTEEEIDQTEGTAEEKQLVAEPAAETPEASLQESAQDSIPADWIAIPRVLLVVLVAVTLVSSGAVVVFTYLRLSQSKRN